MFPGQMYQLFVGEDLGLGLLPVAHIQCSNMVSFITLSRWYVLEKQDIILIQCIPDLFSQPFYGSHDRD